MVVERLAVVAVDRELASARSLRLGRMRVEGPVAHVQVVDVALDDHVAARPDEVLKVMELVFHFRLLGSARSDPGAVVTPVGPQKEQVAQRTVANPLDAFDVSGAMAALQAHANLQPLLLGQLVALHQRAEAGRIDTARLFEKGVLARRHRRGIVDRTKTGRRASSTRSAPHCIAF